MMLKKWSKLFFSLICLGIFIHLCSGCVSLKHVHPTTKAYYAQLKKELVKQGYKDRLMVISGKRPKWWNSILTNFGAAKKSQHLKGNAIDILVLDVNDDGKKDTKDVDIVYRILNQKIIGNKGGIGTYKTEKVIWNRQMVHIDCRGYRARWHR